MRCEMLEESTREGWLDGAGIAIRLNMNPLSLLTTRWSFQCSTLNDWYQLVLPIFIDSADAFGDQYFLFFSRIHLVPPSGTKTDRTMDTLHVVANAEMEYASTGMRDWRCTPAELRETCSKRRSPKMLVYIMVSDFFSSGSKVF